MPHTRLVIMAVDKSNISTGMTNVMAQSFGRNVTTVAAQTVSLYECVPPPEKYVSQAHLIVDVQLQLSVYL